MSESSIPPECSITFDAGTLVLTLTPEAVEMLGQRVRFDDRIGRYRAEASDYSLIVRMLYACRMAFSDTARDYQELPDLTLYTSKRPMAHQTAALAAWKESKYRSVIVMPTGSGKTFFAFMVMAMVRRSTLIVVPTIDLMQQWASQIERDFHCHAGMLGGGSHDIAPITVSTYDSALLQMEFIGNRFGLVIFDECHHLPGPMNRAAASMCLAPYRLGLTATPEREDGGEALFQKLIGPIAYYAHIDELEGTVLAPYITRRLRIPLAEDELSEYTAARKQYTDFIRANRVDFSARDGWTQFMILCARRPGGHEVMNAYLKQRRIARCSRGKLDAVWKIIRENPAARTIVFTADNDTAYSIGELMCLPVLTHKTKAAERKDFLERFRSGEYPVLVTSKVLNEGVDVPEASIGIVVSGSASTREHVQRLGRILRRSRDGKEAVLYELVSENTSEMSVSDRRRQHRAYQARSFHYTAAKSGGGQG